MAADAALAVCPTSAVSTAVSRVVLEDSPVMATLAAITFPPATVTSAATPTTAAMRGAIRRRAATSSASSAATKATTPRP